MKSETLLRDITASARAGLRGSWGKSMGVMLLYAFLIAGVSRVPVAGGLLQLVFAAPLVVGIHMYFLASIKKQPNPLKLLFEGFGRFGLSWCSHILVVLIIFAWMLPFSLVLPAVFFFVHPDPAIFPSYTLPAVYALVVLFACCFLIILQMRYYFVLYLVADGACLRARDAVRRSRELMEGNYWRLAVLWLRFIGWQILAVLTFGIGFLWLIPYMSAATAAFYLDIKDKG
jgi:uncharacterized membrane protein